MYPVLNEAFSRHIAQPLYDVLVADVDKSKFMIKINHSAYDILKRCNGEKSISDIKNELFEEYDESRDILSDFVDGFFEDSAKYGHIYYAKESQDRKGKLIDCGTYDYWTPEFVVLELTYACPLHCKHCYQTDMAPATMDDKMIDKVLHRIIDMGIQRVQLTGGEPLMHPQFFYILENLLQAGVMVYISTNGYICDEKTIERLSKYKGEKLEIQVSLDGLKETHDTFRGVSGAFEKTSLFIKAMIECGYPVTVACCISDQGLDEIKQLCQYIKKMGVSIFRLGSIAGKGNAVHNNLTSTSFGITYLKSMFKELSKIESNESFHIIMGDADAEKFQSKYMPNCGFGQTILRISPSGEVFPCILSDLKIGDLKKEEITDIQKKYSRELEKISPPCAATCKGCEFENVCNNCINEGTRNGGNPNVVCRWQKQLPKDISWSIV